MYIDPDDFDEDYDDDSNVPDDDADDGNPPQASEPRSSGDDYVVTLADMGLDYDGFSWDDVGGD